MLTFPYKKAILSTKQIVKVFFSNLFPERLFSKSRPTFLFKETERRLEQGMDILSILKDIQFFNIYL